LGSHFTKQVFSNNNRGENDGNVEFGSCSSSVSGKAEFFLGTFANHACAGADWIGTFCSNDEKMGNIALNNPPFSYFVIVLGIQYRPYSTVDAKE
jgi:hypothetical protein